jgi:hypothetical protein
VSSKSSYTGLKEETFDTITVAQTIGRRFSRGGGEMWNFLGEGLLPSYMDGVLS